VSAAGGQIVCSARNRVNDSEGPRGEIFGSALAHAETNVPARLPHRMQSARIGPRRDELGTFATLIYRFVHLPPAYEEALRALGEGPMVDLVRELEDGGEVERLAAMDVAEGLGHPWPRLQELAKVLPA
jgi:hypothetical protein